jgi:hypothetical protein
MAESAGWVLIPSSVLEHDVGQQLEGLALVDPPPQEFVALEAGGVAGFGEVNAHALQ